MAEAIDFYLVKETYSKDQYGQLTASLSRRQLLGERESVTRAEWSAAGENGLQAQWQINMFAPDYEGEKVLQMYDESSTLQSYGIYRTFRRGDTLELYLEWKVGDSNGPAPEDPADPVDPEDENDGTESDG
jgi:hypothetical protein